MASEDVRGYYEPKGRKSDAEQLLEAIHAQTVTLVEVLERIYCNQIDIEAKIDEACKLLANQVPLNPRKKT